MTSKCQIELIRQWNTTVPLMWKLQWPCWGIKLYLVLTEMLSSHSMLEGRMKLQVELKRPTLREPYWTHFSFLVQLILKCLTLCLLLVHILSIILPYITIFNYIYLLFHFEYLIVCCFVVISVLQWRRKNTKEASCNIYICLL